jgi:hypothetical protein
MNERIKELAKQAGASYYNTYTGPLLSPKDIEKFAELIVKECSNIAWQYTPDTEDLEYSHLIKDKILEHFGVEE